MPLVEKPYLTNPPPPHCASTFGVVGGFRFRVDFGFRVQGFGPLTLKP